MKKQYNNKNQKTTELKTEKIVKIKLITTEL